MKVFKANSVYFARRPPAPATTISRTASSRTGYNSLLSAFQLHQCTFFIRSLHWQNIQFITFTIISIHQYTKNTYKFWERYAIVVNQFAKIFKFPTDSQHLVEYVRSLQNPSKEGREKPNPRAPKDWLALFVSSYSAHLSFVMSTYSLCRLSVLVNALK